jgi:hypothetical protein
MLDKWRVSSGIISRGLSISTTSWSPYLDFSFDFATILRQWLWRLTHGSSLRDLWFQILVTDMFRRVRLARDFKLDDDTYSK